MPLPPSCASGRWAEVGPTTGTSHRANAQIARPGPAWTGETLYQNRYFVDDLVHRLLVFVQMAAVAAIGLSVSDAFGDLSAQLAIAYAIVRAMLFTMFMRVKGSHPHSADVSTAYQVGFGVGIGLFLGAPVLSPDVRWIVWLLAIAFEIVYFARPSSMAATRTEQISALDLDNADRQAIGIVEDPKLVKA